MVGIRIIHWQGKKEMFDFNDIDQFRGLELRVSLEIQEQAWQQAQKQSNRLAQYNAFVNYNCVLTVLDWFSDLFLDSCQEKPILNPSLEELPTVWEFVTGSVIQFHSIRLVIIPIDELETGGFAVPQEWVDIPQWIGDYYIAVQILEDETEESKIRIWGFTTHQQLKQKGSFEDSDRTYNLPLDSLVKDLTLLPFSWGLDFRTEVPSLAELTPLEIDELVRIFSHTSVYSPRLQVEISFEKWASLLQHEVSRKKLYTCRINPLHLQESFAKDDPEIKIETTELIELEKPIKLRQWLQQPLTQAMNTVDRIWQSWEFLWMQPQAIAMRGYPTSKTTSPDAIASILHLLNPQQPSQTRRQAAGVLGEIASGHPQAIQALMSVLEQDIDEETRWQASLSLGKIDPGNPLASVQKARLIDLGMQLEGQKIGLIVSIMPKDNDRINVYLQLQPLEDGKKLPVNLQLAIFSEFGESIPGLETYARAEDDCLENHQLIPSKDQVLKLRFTPPAGTRFQVRVSLGDRIMIEDFVA